MVMTQEQELMIEKAIDYIDRVTFKQERLLSCNDLYNGFKSGCRSSLTEYGFKVAYDAYKDTLQEVI